MNKNLVYISSPYTGDEQANTDFQIDTAENLRNLGFLPYWPLCTHYWNLKYSHSWEYWMEQDLEWIVRCDIVLRLGGKSRGADMEVAVAKRLDIPVVYSIEELFKLYKDTLP
jgi:hypothetical protein